jgi:hypothetical protein
MLLKNLYTRILIIYITILRYGNNKDKQNKEGSHNIMDKKRDTNDNYNRQSNNSYEDIFDVAIVGGDLKVYLLFYY